MRSLPLAGIFVALAIAADAERGADGSLSIAFWQAPSTMNPYLSGGKKDIDAASLVLEPLAYPNQDGILIPWLVDAIPSRSNGGINEDYTSITWTLREGLLWSDGTELSSEDVVFTANYCMHPDGACAQLARFDGIQSIEAINIHTVRINFESPRLNPYNVFTGASTPILQKSQFQKCLGKDPVVCLSENAAPIGTGPFVVSEFRAHDGVELQANPNFRDPAKPTFASVSIIASESATAAASQVVEEGVIDYAWSLQLTPDEIAAFQDAEHGNVVFAFGPLVEKIVVNLTDPSPELGDERSTLLHPHPILTDRIVRQALSLAIDRNAIVAAGYGRTGKPTCNLIPAPQHLVSDANESCLDQDIEGARQLLQDAGWVVGGDGIRERNGIRLSLEFQTSTNVVRQKTQMQIQRWWAEIGVETKLKDINPSVFFGSDPESVDTVQRFYADIAMYTDGFEGTDPENYLGSWRCGTYPKPENRWQGTNMARFCNREYDILQAKLSKTGDPDQRINQTKALNDILAAEFVAIPLVHRGQVFARSKKLAGVKLNVWDSEFWNAADWHIAE